MKEPVFQFYVTLTKEDYIRYNRTIVWRYKRSKWMLIPVLSLHYFPRG